jgi:hypothetical protein
MDRKGISLMLGKSIAWVAVRLKIAMMPDDAKGLVANGKITLQQAEILARIQDQDTVAAFAKVCANSSWTTARLIHEVEKLSTELSEAPFKTDKKIRDDQGTIGPCTECAQRSSAQKDLFGKTEDRCLSPECWARKVADHIRHEKQKLSKLGKTVAEPEEYFKKDSGYAKSEKEKEEAIEKGVAPEILVTAKGNVEVYRKPKIEESRDEHDETKEAIRNLCVSRTTEQPYLCVPRTMEELYFARTLLSLISSMLMLQEAADIVNETIQSRKDG